MDKAIEAAAKAVHAAIYGTVPFGFSDKTTKKAREIAEAAIAAHEAASDTVQVPREPTEKMVEAGSWAFEIPRPDIGPTVTQTGLDTDVVTMVYRAMLAAHEERKGG